MIRINQLKAGLDYKEDDLVKLAANKAGIKVSDIKEFNIVKKSIDARKKDQVHYTFSVDIAAANEENIIKKSRSADIIPAPKVKYHIPKRTETSEGLKTIIVGAGPAGLFCAYLLAVNGMKPVVIERGSSVTERSRIVENYWKTGSLDTRTNVQFGEGGAGTFSDGKLNSMVKDTYGRIAFILNTFVSFGASKEITYLNKPHIGTDVLKEVVVNMRNEIIRLGGTFHFETCMTSIDYKNNQIVGINTDKGYFACDRLVLAIGHSARDTFHELYGKLNMEPKAFAMGVRCEHKQDMISKAMYGNSYKKLPAADYKLTYTTSKGRNVYSFCMCPGGYVVNSSSEEGRICVNGMSYSKRDGENANSALVINVTPEDFLPYSKGNDVLAGIEFQRFLEEQAYKEGHGTIPVQTYKDFKDNKVTEKLGDIKPQIKGSYSFGNLNNVFPAFMNEALIEGMESFGHKINGFDNDDVIFSAVEARTSSPVRITRDNDTLMSNIFGIYPCGEGAGYAGGITSAAIDGIKVAEKIIAS